MAIAIVFIYSFGIASQEMPWSPACLLLYSDILQICQERQLLVNLGNLVNDIKRQ